MASPSPAEIAKQTTKDLAVLQATFDYHKTQYDNLQLTVLRETVAVLSERVARLEKAKDEADKRQWQFVYITLGVIGSLLSGLVVQLLLWALKK